MLAKNEEIDRSEEIRLARAEIARIVDRYCATQGDGPTPVPGLAVGRATAPIPPTSYVFEPSLCISARGSKRVRLGQETFVYDEDNFLLTTFGLPSIIEVSQASDATPYTALQIELDLPMARQVISDLDVRGIVSHPGGPGMATGPVDADLLDAVVRLVRLLERPGDIPFLQALVHREILYRILLGPTAARLRQLVQIGTQTSRVARAIERLRRDFTKRLSVDELAEESGMGVSTLHHHFRELTTMSPLQFQKQLRLHEARRLMLNEDADAASAAFQVGYESVTQFSREYRRQFGAPPARDIKAMRSAVAADQQSRTAREGRTGLH
ncbi:AraC family transcriptional regulator [Xenophilus azovorans]|uniref:AraC family transcriptional regulator n=1 Tax=Xenophilus azovorans TaxID=151755 RepID=UPI000690441F|nr:AraC family transcriptional regulator [Xenophilus azovorans]